MSCHAFSLDPAARSSASVPTLRPTRFARPITQNRKNITQTRVVMSGRFAWWRGPMKSSKRLGPLNHLSPGSRQGTPT